MALVITPCDAQDLSVILEFYDHAIALQKKVSPQHWQGFELTRVQAEINDNRHYKILVGEEIACIFLISLNDPEIWLERDLSPSIYLHRIVTHPNFRGHGLVAHITNWAMNYAKEHQRSFVRMDTWADNKKLINYYQSFGFKDAGTITIGADSGLPKHYEGVVLQLFEIAVPG